MVHLHERRPNRTLHSTNVQSLCSATFLYDLILTNGYTLNGYYTLYFLCFSTVILYLVMFQYLHSRTV